MTTIDNRISEIYSEFQGFPPKNSIVRANQPNDAFTVVVFETLLQNYHGIKKFIHSDTHHREVLFSSIGPSPDDGIDIFYEEKQLDESKFHVVQVKNVNLTPADILDCFIKMEHTIKQYLKKARDINKNLREIISNTDFSSQYKNQIAFYVAHRGDINLIRGQKTNQFVVTAEELNILSKSAQQMSVPSEIFEIDDTNNFIINNFVESKIGTKMNPNLPQSLLCNLSGYDLAKLNNKYSNTLLGRNILYSQNLRESLYKTSKTFEKMFETIEKEPELFLYYNNGITILSTYFNAKNKSQILLENFSIINGAQTTSTLGAYLRQAELNNELEKIENLKRIFVLTKIYQINNSLPNHKIVSEQIKIFNNTQTPLSSRDMVSIRKEQINLQRKYLECQPPNIFINIKKGVDVPAHPKTYPHQRVNNETLAQLALCGFFSEPFTAKDKKTKIFDNDSKDEFALNEIYHKLFDETDGKLFKIDNYDLDELLFIYKLHEDTKKLQKNFLKDQINNINQVSPKDDLDKQTKEQQVDRIRRNLDIYNVCLFFNMTTYYEIKNSFGAYIKESGKTVFDFRRYYDDKNFKESMIKDFQKLYYSKTVEIIRKNSGVENVNNWIRAEKNEIIFLKDLRDLLINDGFIIKEQYVDFVKTYKVGV